ncbi:MAG: DUF3168 domain-containing protein [Bacteroidales bacterium]|nr:DUF3168 domain-containing protein [Bacteroidales bacterium]
MSLRIGRYIQFALSRDAGVQTATEGRIYPVVSPEDRPVPTPYIVFASNGLEEASTKDGIAYDTVTEEILCFGSTLDACEALADTVREAMFKAWLPWNREKASEEGFEIQDQGLRVGSEDYDIAHAGYFVPMLYTIETAKID